MLNFIQNAWRGRADRIARDKIASDTATRMRGLAQGEIDSAIKKAEESAKEALTKEANAMAEKMVAKETKDALRSINRKGISYHIGRLGVIKSTALGAGILAGVAALGAVAFNWRSNQAKASREAIRNGADTELPEIPAMQQPTMMGIPPQPGQHAQRVLAGRGLAQQQAAINPEMTAAAAEDASVAAQQQGR